MSSRPKVGDFLEGEMLTETKVISVANLREEIIRTRLGARCTLYDTTIIRARLGTIHRVYTFMNIIKGLNVKG